MLRGEKIPTDYSKQLIEKERSTDFEMLVLQYTDILQLLVDTALAQSPLFLCHISQTMQFLPDAGAYPCFLSFCFVLLY